MKRVSKFLLIGMILITLISGCGKQPSTILPKNDVLSLTPYDVNKETLVINISDGIDKYNFKDSIERAFPDVNFILRSGMNSECVLGDIADIYLLLAPNLTPELESELLDLSIFNSTSNYYTSSLEGYVSPNDGKQYVLPLPANIRGIVYNKTMFEENGWEVPKGKTEFIKLCQKIDASGVVERAFQPTLLFPNEVLVLGEFFQMANTFDTLDYFKWAEDYGKFGTGSIDYILPSLINTYDELLSANVIKISDFNMKPAIRSTMMYKNRSAAMTI
ncbi:MAG: hypothetical protein WBO70_03220 [Erysipelotrichaceae bacterium]